ncbi:hypothetical protein BN1183_CU_00160 [Pantoea ananatis]|nr:hypothetical protein BN1183_CU_00160 [Pantoea ananatis]
MYSAATFAPGSAATVNLSRHSSLENFSIWSVLPAVTPITVAPSFLKSSVASAKACASKVQPALNAAGKK